MQAAGAAFELDARVDLDGLFGLAVHEYVYCSACNKVSYDSRYTQYIYNTQVNE